MKKTTELGVDLKTYLLKDARMQPGREYTGVLKRDRALNENGYDDNHYTFVEMANRRAKIKSRYLYRGKCINLLQREDGTLFLTYRWPKLSEAYTFLDFCSEAINEIYIAASLTRKEDETKRSGLVKKD